jgi:predicted permease
MTWFRDIAYGLRVFARAPGFAVAVVLTAAIGIAANAAVFSVLNALFFRPLPVADPHEIVRVYTSDGTARQGQIRFGNSSYPDYLDLRQAPALAGLAAYVPIAVNLRQGEIIRRAEGRLVSGNFFEVLGVKPALGRFFSAADLQSADTPPVVLTHAFWRTAFSSDPAVLGTTVNVNGTQVFILGVAAPVFTGIELSRVDVYLPISAQPGGTAGFTFFDNRGARLLKIVGRLRAGVSETRAADDLNVIMGNLQREYPQSNADRMVNVRSASSLFDQYVAGDGVMAVMTLLFAVSGVLLLIAVVNVAALLLAHTVARRQEIAVRVSLGATRSRVIRQLLTESAVLGVTAEVLALGVLAIAVPAAMSLLGVPETIHLGIDLRVLGFASGVTLLATLLFTLAPALRGTALSAATSLRESHGSAPPYRARTQRTLVVVQVALSIILLVTAGLLIDSLRRQRDVPTGFETTHLLTAEFETLTGQQTPEQEHTLAQTILAQVRALPGVVSASVTTHAPFTSDGVRRTIDVPGYTWASDESRDVHFVNAGSDYCAALGLRVVRGEEIRADRGDALPRVLVNETMARRFWPDRDPVGSAVRLGGSRGTLAQVIAVVGDARMLSLAEPPTAYFIVQDARGGGSTILIRTAADPADLTPVIERTFAAPDGEWVLRQIRTMDEVMVDSVAANRALTAAVSGVSVVALVLAVCGLYAAISYLAAQRRREFAIRMALGAKAGDVLRMVIGSGLRVVFVGTLVGVTLSLPLSVVLPRLLFSGPSAGIPTLLLVTAIIGVVSLGACAIPAFRATRTSPLTALRSE